MPKVMTGRQRRFMYAELGKKERGQRGDTDMTVGQIRKYVKKHVKKSK